MENEGARSPSLLSRAIVVVLILGAVVTGTIAFSAQARAEDQQIIIHDEDDEPKAPFYRKPGGYGFDGYGRSGPGSSIAFDALLAEALGIGVEELQEAYAEASSAALDQAVAQGSLSEEQADMMKARRALKQYLNRDDLLAAALGISVDDLQEARADGKKLSILLDELGLDGEDLHQMMQAAYEDAVGQAVRDGVITQDQADQILNGDMRGHRRPGFRPHPDRGSGFEDHHDSEPDPNQNSNTSI